MGEEPEPVSDSFADRHAILVVLIPVMIVFVILVMIALLTLVVGFDSNLD